MRRARRGATAVLVALGLLFAVLPSVDATPTAHRRVTQISGWRAPASSVAIGSHVLRRVHVSGPAGRWVQVQRLVDRQAVRLYSARTDRLGFLTVRLPVQRPRAFFRLYVPRTAHYTARPTAWITVLGVGATPVPGPTPDPTPTPPVDSAGSIDTGDRQAVLDAYQARFEATTRQLGEWDGDENGCRAGGVSEHFRVQTIGAVNFFRAMVGSPPVTIDDSLSALAQQAALVMDANRQLNHYPPSAWACWSQAAYDGASHSNLWITWSDSGADPTLTAGQPIADYMDDTGVESVGHRLWIMYPYATTMGVGATQHAQALWVVPASRASVTPPPFMPWPSPGYFPSALVPASYWSFSATDGTSLEGASVSVVGPDGAPLAVSGIHLGAGILGSTLVWSVHPPKPQADTTYTVHITGPVDHWYKVTIIPVP